MPRTEKQIFIGGVSLDQKGLRTTAVMSAWCFLSEITFEQMEPDCPQLHTCKLLDFWTVCFDLLGECRDDDIPTWTTFHIHRSSA